MLPEDKYFRTLSKEELWQRYCGFLDISVDEFLSIQESLLMNQINTVYESPLGKAIMGDTKPESVGEFRENVRFTTFDDYEPYIGDRKEDALAFKPAAWAHSSGRGGHFKWYPISQDYMDVFSRLFIAYMILATATRRGEVRVRTGERVIINLPPRPYASGVMAFCACQVLTMYLMPPLEENEQMDFQERIQIGFQMGLNNGVDLISTTSSILVKIGEAMSVQARNIKLSIKNLNPRFIYSVLRALFLSKIHKRQILPKDLWSPKGIITGGTDTSIYKDEVKYYWGIEPLEIFAGTEGPYATQNWNRKWLTPIPQAVFLEFIPEDESIKLREDPNFVPSTVLIDELEEGKVYELVITQFYGMPLLRYRIGDTVRVVAMEDEETGVKLPQLLFEARIGETIDLASLARLTEKVVWQAISNTGVKYEDWSARKEYEGSQALLHIYIELKEGEVPAAELELMIDKQLWEIDIDYRDIKEYLNLQPVRVHILPKGSFDRYYQKKVSEGADLAHLKPPHINASDAIIKQLLQQD